MLQADYLRIRNMDEEASVEVPCFSLATSGLPAKVDLPHLHHSAELQSVELARHYIHANFCDNLRVEEIAKEVFMSQYHFSRIFKKHTNYSPYQYLLEIRLQHARKLMFQKGLTIKEITFRSGFNSTDYFSAAFSKKFSVCPSTYKKRVHNN